MSSTLATAVTQLAQTCHTFSDADLDQEWSWGPHAEGIRFALIGTYHELRDLALKLTAERVQKGLPPSMAQHALAQYHVAYRDLQSILLGVSDATYGREPAPGEWPLRYIIGHMVGAERAFFTLVHYGMARQRDGEHRSAKLPDGEVDRVMGARDDLLDIMENRGLDVMLAYYDVLHQRVLDECADISDSELQGPSVWWEGEPFTLQHRLHRFDAHLCQHTIQAQKTLAALGHPANEAQRLLRLVYNALAEVEGIRLGAEKLGADECATLAKQITGRNNEVAALVSQTRTMTTAVAAGDLPQVQQLLTKRPTLVNTLDQQRLPVVLTALYHGHKEIAETLVEAGAELSIFEAAALGRLDVVKREIIADPDDINLYGRDGFTPLQLACYFAQPQVALWLIENGADVTAVSQNTSQLTALHAAAAGGDLTIVEALLEAGCDVNAQQEGGFTALHTAAQNGNLNIVQLLLAHNANPDLTTDDGKTACNFAQTQQHKAVITLLDK